MSLSLRPEYQVSLTIRQEFSEGSGILVESNPSSPFILRMMPYLKGDPGDAASQFTHTQTVAATTWTVNHNKGYRPDAHVYTPGWVEVEANVVHTSENQLVVQFNTPQTGFVTC